ncbi:hypothetical protein ACFGVR_09965 [Mucilaginibacter sp. AW1-3]
MDTHADKTQENKSRAAAHSLSKLQSTGESAFEPEVNQPETTAQLKLHQEINNSARVKQLKAYQAMADRYLSKPVQRNIKPEEETMQGKFAVAPTGKLKESSGDIGINRPQVAYQPATSGQPIQRVLKTGKYTVTKDSTMRSEDHAEVIKLKEGDEVNVDGSKTKGSLFTTGLYFGKKEHSWSTLDLYTEGWVVDEALRFVPAPVVVKAAPKREAPAPKAKATVVPDQPVVISSGPKKSAEQAPAKKTTVSAPVSATPVVIVAPPVVPKSYEQQVTEWLATLNPLNVDNIKTVKDYFIANKATLKGTPLQLINNFLRVHGLNTAGTATNFIAGIEDQFQGQDVTDKMLIFSKMMVAVNASMRALGYPEMTIKESSAVSGGAVFAYQTWEMLVNPASVGMRTSVITLLYHESRHSEQWFKMIIGQLKKGKKKTQIVSEMGVPGNIVDQAVLKADLIAPQEIAAANVYHQSVYGTGAAKRNETLNSGKIHDKSTKEHRDYRNLPEEVDAYDTQERVGDAVTERIKELIDLIAISDEEGILYPLMQKLEFLCKMDGKIGKLKPVAETKIAKLGPVKMANLKSYVRALLTRLAA